MMMQDITGVYCFMFREVDVCVYLVFFLFQVYFIYSCTELGKLL